MSILKKIAGGFKAVVGKPISSFEGRTDRRTEELTEIVLATGLPKLIEAGAELLERLDSEDRLKGLGADLLQSLAESGYAVVIRLEKRPQ